MKKYDQKITLLSLINEKILNRSTEERYRLMHETPSKSKKRWIPTVALSVAAVLLLSAVTVWLIPLLAKQIPVYTGMTVSASPETSYLERHISESPTLAVAYKSAPKDGLMPSEEETAKDKDPLESVQAAEDLYVARSGEKICITIHFDNPEQYEILSFTINGVKYGSHMFLDGSDMERLIVEYQVPKDAEGVIECTIDAIKYVDGSKIKDVKIGGEQTVKIHVVSVSSLSFDLNGGTCEEELPTFYYKDFENKLPIPQKEGYIFGGWLCGGQETPVYAIPMGTSGDLTVKAVWKDISLLLGDLCDATGGRVIKEFYSEQRFVESTQDYRAHIGVDIAVVAQASVYAVAEGEIYHVGVDDCGSLIVEIKLLHNDVVIRYGNFDALAPGIDVGVSVNVGDVIGYAGGASVDPVCASEPHVHFGIRSGTAGWMDPQK